MKRTTLDTGWTLTISDDDVVPEALRGRIVAAEVPGCVHTDLLSAELISDPYLDDNEQTQHWIGDATWTYRTDVDVSESEPDVRRELVFEGLDTVATVVVNGVVLCRTANMHRRYVVDVTDAMTPGSNNLEVIFGSARAYAYGVKDRVGDFPANYPEPYNYIRKMAANFGWDWGPTLVTAGIWKSVELVEWTTARLESVRPAVAATFVDGEWVGTVDLELSVLRARPDASLSATLRVAGTEAVIAIPRGESSAAVRIEVRNPDLWWPTGFGDATLYDLSLTLEDETAVLDRDDRRVGFRSANLITEDDIDGRSFGFEINGVPIRIRGFNWIPDDCFVSRVGAERYRARLEEAVAANANLLRVWGGGIYEKDEFYDTCDELGLLVWQDFPFACATYPEDEVTWKEVEAEARDNVVRLISRPSLVLWNGNNENIWGYEDWGWKPALAGRPWGSGYYYDLLPGILRELDPERAYTPGSPYSAKVGVHPNDPGYGTSHIWDVWNQVDYTHYAAYRPRFVSEFGFQGPAQWSTIVESISRQPITPEAPLFLAHQKANDGAAKLLRGMAPHLPAPRTEDPLVGMDDWHYLTQLNQARAVEFGVRHFRTLGDRCQGAIVWQLNDCWPATSWAAIDSGGRRKPLWYAIRRAFAPLLFGIDRTDAAAAYIVNDTPNRARGVVEVRRVDLAGTTLAAQSSVFDVQAGSALRVPLDNDVATPGEPRNEILVLDGPTGRTVFPFVEDTELMLPGARFDVDVNPVPDGVAVTVHAHTMLRDIVLVADRIDPDAVVDDQLVTLFPGESHAFEVRTSASAADDRWREYPVVSCVNAIPRTQTVALSGQSSEQKADKHANYQ